VRPEDPDWRPRYERYNHPGHYHNGGIWPFVCGFYIAALVAAGRSRLAKQKLAALAATVQPAREASVAFGFNEWLRAQDGTPCGQDWQSWSASMYLYAETAVRRGEVPLLDAVRKTTSSCQASESA
jgi:glycogen debranching enzyme